MYRLHYWPTPNGKKITIALEEMGLPYTVKTVDITRNQQFEPDFLRISPNNRIPAIVDPEGPDGRPISVFESGAILLYLADKTGKLIPVDPIARWETIEWVFFQMAAIGPMFGQVGFFHRFAGKDYEDKRPRDRYVAESRRLLGVLDARLDGRDWIMGDYSIADIAIAPWVNTLAQGYKAGELLGLDALNFANEGKLLIAVAREAAESVLAHLRSHPLGRDAAIIGEVVPRAGVRSVGLYGVKRTLDLPHAEPLPRIC